MINTQIELKLNQSIKEKEIEKPFRIKRNYSIFFSYVVKIYCDIMKGMEKYLRNKTEKTSMPSFVRVFKG